MGNLRKKLLSAGAIVLGVGAAGLGMHAAADPYFHDGYGPGYHHRGGYDSGYHHRGGYDPGYHQAGYGYRDGPCWETNGDAAAGRQDYAGQRESYIRDRLQLTSEQEKAFREYRVALAANTSALRQRDMVDFANMSAPERLEKRQQIIKERDARMAEHLAALKTFYATLTPEQQKIFDMETGPRRAFDGYRYRGRWHRGPAG